MTETTETFVARLRSDRRKHPEMRNYRYLTFEECKNLSSHCLVCDDHGTIAEVKITSQKAWKTRPQIEIHWKYGLYDYGYETIYPDRPQCFFVVEA